MADEQQVLDAALAMLNASLPAQAKACAQGKVPEPFPAKFVTAYAVRRSGGTSRAGRHSTRGWALYLTGVSRVSEEDARLSLRTCTDALENKVLVVGDERSTPMRFDTARPIDKPRGSEWHSGVVVFHFAI